MYLSNNLKELKSNIFKKENIFSLVVISTIFFLDRYSKTIIIKDFSEQKYFLNDYLNLDLIWNTGIGFGFLSTDLDLFYNFVTLIIGSIIILLIYFLIISEILDKLIYSLIIGGALGNFYDRVFYKAVPDFIDLHFDNFHWFTFNVADIFITIGIIIFAMRSFFIKS